MEKAKVYFTSMRTVGDENICDKLVRLCKTAGIENIDFKDKFTAIKLHFGEDGNLAFLRPDYARAIADLIKKLGGKPFVTDCSTLYVGRRKNALDHLDLAYQHGYNPFSTGCQTIIADGLKGDDDVEVPVPNGEYVKNAKIGRAMMDADVFISLTHFKGHEGTGFGGTLKNIGMGCGSTRGKAEMHETEKPMVHADECVACGICAENCAHGAITVDTRAHVDYDKCKGCGRCIGVCPEKAMRPGEEDGCEILSRKIAEYTMAVCNNRPCFHITLLIDVSPFCDCYGLSDAPVIPDVGMFASFDPVALDKACADAANKQHAIADSFLGEKLRWGRKPVIDHFYTMHPDTKWEAAIDHGEKLGLGTSEYELITME